MSPSLIPYDGERRLRFAAGVERFGRLAHHASGDVERGDPGVQVAIVRARGGVAHVDVAQHDLLQLVQRHRPFGRAQVGYRLRARHDPHSLVDRRQEAAVPDLRAGVRHVLAEHHVRRQARG